MTQFTNASLINPGPDNTSLLYLQRQHVSEAVWQGYEDRILHPRRCDEAKSFYPPQQLIPLLMDAGFYGAACIGSCRVDHALVSALVERWRPETHTFHMPVGEVTITLQDVALLMGLPVDGEPVVGITIMDWASVCQKLLGRRPGDNDLRGQRLSLVWLKRNFEVIPKNATSEQLAFHARAYILMLIGGMLFGDTSSSMVHLMYLPLLENLHTAKRYSWGSATLAHLYRELCCATDYDKIEIGGCVQLLCMWAWERFTPIAPHPYPEKIRQDEYQNLRIPPPLGSRWSNYRGMTQQSLPSYRAIFDRLKDEDFVWTPYVFVPSNLFEGHQIWQANIPLICFHIIEWHCPDRVLRQFGQDQPIPEDPVDIDWEHTQQLKGKMDIDWRTEQERYIKIWNNRHSRICYSIPLVEPLRMNNSQYLRWYWSITRKWIHPNNAVHSQMAEGLERIMGMMATQPPPVNDVIDLCRKMLHMMGESSRLQPNFHLRVALNQRVLPHVDIQSTRQRRRVAGFRLKRKVIQPRVMPQNVSSQHVPIPEMPPS